MMGWRCGYLAYQETGDLGEQLLKIQDTIPVSNNPPPCSCSASLSVSCLFHLATAVLSLESCMRRSVRRS
jgi:hypothetical protein